MKKKNVAVAVVLAAAVSTASLAACSGGCGGSKNDLNLSDYAMTLEMNSGKDFTKQSGYTKARTTSTRTNYRSITNANSLKGNLAIATTVSEGDTTYSLYDLDTKAAKFSGLGNITSATSTGMGGRNVTYYKLISSGDTTTYRYAGPDGELLVNNSFESDDLRLSYVETLTIDGEDVYIYAATYTVGENEETRHFKLYKDDNGDDAWAYMSETEFEEAEGSENEYTVGTTLGLEKTDVMDFYNLDAYGLKKDDLAHEDWMDYTFTMEGDVFDSGAGVMTFYDGNDKEKGSLELVNAQLMTTIGQYLYYYEVNFVSADATKGYNYEIFMGTASVKANYVLHRYDFVKNKNEEVDCDYIMTSFEPLYNHTDKTFDKIYIDDAMKKENGVAVNYSAVPSMPATQYKIVLNEKGKLCADLTASAIDIENLYRLSDTRFLSGNTIFDEDEHIVAQLPSTTYIWEEQELLICPSTGLCVDYDGKVVIEPVAEGQSLGGVSGDTIYAYDSEESEYYIYNKNYPTGYLLSNKFSVGENDVLTVRAGMVYTRIDNSEKTAYDYKLSDFNGNAVLTLTNVSNSSLNVNVIGDYAIVSAAEGESETATWIIS